MASSRRTFDTDSITLRTINARNENNALIPALRSLTSDGSGGTLWKIPSSFGSIPSFNQIITDAGTFTADLSFNTFRLTSGEGIGMVGGSNETFLFAKAFGQVDVSGANSLYSFSNGIVQSRFTIATTGALQLRTNPSENTLFIDGPLTTQISSGFYGFNKIRVIPTVSTIASNIQNVPGNSLFADSPSTQLTFAGIGDVILSSFYSTNTVYFTVSSYSAREFLAMSTIANTLGASVTSTLNNDYVFKTDFSTGAIGVSTTSFSNASSILSSINGISSFFVTQFNILTGLINARATIAQVNTNVSNFQTAISSFSTNYIELSQFISSSAGLVNQVSSIVTISNVSSIFLFGGTLRNFSVGSILFDQSDVSTLSTATGASISTTSNALFSQLAGNLLSTASSVNSLGSIGYISSLSLASTVIGLGSVGYVSTLSLTSTINGLGTFGFFSTSFLDRALPSTSKGITDSLGSFGYISTPTLQSTLQSTSQGIVNSLGSLGYISTQSLNSTLQSTSQGIFDNLGSFSYISTSGLNQAFRSTVTGLGTFGYISIPTLDFVLQSTATAALSNAFISSLSLTSTTQGLGSIGYLSTASLVSTVSSLIQIVSTAFSPVSLKSSILYAGCNGSIDTFVDAGTNDMFFSSAQFSLGSFSSFIRDKSQILVDVNENFIFSPVSFAGEIKSLSSFVVSDKNMFFDTLINDTIVQQFDSYSNVYMKNLTFNLLPNDVQTSYTSSFSLVHRIPEGFQDSYFGIDGFTFSTMRIQNSVTNSIFVTILN